MRLSTFSLLGAWVADSQSAIAQLPPALPATSLDAALVARAALPAVLGPDRSSVAGTYTGIAGCRGAIDRITLTLQPDARGLLSATYSRQPWVQQMPRPTDQPVVNALPLVGAYDSRTGVFGLGPAPGSPRDPRMLRPVQVLGVFQDGAAGLVMRPRFGDGNWCEVHVARRGTDLPREWQAIAEQPAPKPPGSSGFAIFKLPEKVIAARDALRRECEAPVMPWLQQLTNLVDAQDFRRDVVLANLFSDALFVPHFGKPFSKLSDSDRADFSAQLRGSCSVQKEGRLRNLMTVLPGELPLAFMNAPQVLPDVDKVASNTVLSELRRWRDHARNRLEEVSTQAQHPGLVDQWLTAAKPMTDLLLSGERRAFDELALASRRSMGVVFLTQKIDQSPAASAPTLDALERLITEVRGARREMPSLTEAAFQQANERLAAFVAAQVGAAADAHGAAAQTASDALNLGRWRETYPQVWAMLPEPRRQDPWDRIDRARLALVTRLAQDEARAFAERRTSTLAPLPQLERLMEEEARLARTYTTLLRETPFAEFNAARSAARVQALQLAEPELQAAFAATAHLRPLKALRSRYLSDLDLGSAPGQRLAQAWQTRAAAISPFSGYPAEDYMSALYSGDFETVRQTDAQLVARARALTAALGPIFSFMDMLGRGAAGGALGSRPASEAVDASIARLSHVTPMLALYLGRWQREPGYQACLQPATKITVTTRVTETTRYRFGLENTTTSESQQIFFVPERHAALAERVGLKDSKGLSQLSDNFFAPGSALTFTAALDSMQRMMRELDCQSPAARRMDAQMVSYYNGR